MRKNLEEIAKKCTQNDLKISVEDRNGELAYRVEGFSKSGNALLYVEDDEIICETRYDQKDHILCFNDLVLVAKCWFESYKDRKPFEEPEEEWKPVFDRIYSNFSGTHYVKHNVVGNDLPF